MRLIHRISCASYNTTVCSSGGVFFSYKSGGVLDKVTNDINNGNVGDAMAMIKRIVHSGNGILDGLVKIRDSEVRLYLEGRYSL